MSDETVDVLADESVSPAQTTVITCEPVVDITVVENLYTHLKRALDERHKVEIDAGEVTRVDASVLQLLCAFFRDADELHLNVIWKNTSETLKSSAKLLGLDSALKLA